MRSFVVHLGNSRVSCSIVLAVGLIFAGCNNFGSVGPAGPQGLPGPPGPNGDNSRSVSQEYNTPFTYQKIPGSNSKSCNWSISIYALLSDGSFDSTNPLTDAIAIKDKGACIATPRYNAHQGDWLLAQVTDNSVTYNLIYQAGGTIAGSAQAAPAIINGYSDVVSSFILTGMSVGLLPPSYLSEQQIVDLQNTAAAGSDCSASVKAGNKCTGTQFDAALANKAAAWVNDFSKGGFAVPSVVATTYILVANVDKTAGQTYPLFNLGTDTGVITMDSQTCLPTQINNDPYIVTLTHGIDSYKPTNCSADKDFNSSGTNNHQAVLASATVGDLSLSTEVIALGNGYADNDEHFEQRGDAVLVCVKLSAPSAIFSAKPITLNIAAGKMSKFATNDGITQFGAQIPEDSRSVAIHVHGSGSDFVAGWDSSAKDGGSIQLNNATTGPDGIAFTISKNSWAANEVGTFCVAMVSLSSDDDISNFQNDIINATGASYRMPADLFSMINPSTGNSYSFFDFLIAGMESRALYASSQFLGLLDASFAANTLIGNDIATATAAQRMIYNTNLCTGFLSMIPGARGQVFAGTDLKVNPLFDGLASVLTGNTCFGVAAAAGDTFTVVVPHVTGFVNRTITVSSSLADIDDAAAALGSSN